MAKNFVSGVFSKRVKYLSIAVAISLVTTIGLLQPAQVYTQSAARENPIPSEAASDVTAAFAKVWTLASSCTNVANNEVGLWDDSPGAGTNLEAAFFWFVTDSTDNENCTFRASGNGISTTSFPQLQVRAAVNDGGILKVILKSGSNMCSGGTTIGTITYSGSLSNGGFINQQISLPTGKSVSEVCITLDDNPDSNFSTSDRRTSALIDFILIWRSSTGSFGWFEGFAQSG